jgi:uncharacterized protein (DUF697 family)
MVSTLGEVRSAVDAGGSIRLLGYERESLESIRSALAVGADNGAVNSLVDIHVIDNGSGRLPPFDIESTAVVILAASRQQLSSQEIEDALADIGKAEIPAVLVLTEAPGVELSFPAAGIGPKRVVGIAPDGNTPEDVLAEAIVDASGEASVSLAARLPSLRDEACLQVIRRTARQNSVIGALFIIPGADMPVMTMNEAKMVLRIAAAHGEQLGAERALELLGVVGSGFGLRAIARQALSFLPGPGWAIKSSVAYGGTRAMGKAASAYFTGDVRVTPNRLASLVKKVKNLKG